MALEKRPQGGWSIFSAFGQQIALGYAYLLGLQSSPGFLRETILVVISKLLNVVFTGCDGQFDTFANGLTGVFC